MDEKFHHFMSVIYEINHLMHSLKTECMAEFGLKSSHLLCLYYLYNNSPLCTTKLIKLCCEDKGSISRTVKDLKEKGYIVSHAYLTNVYRAPLVLTEKGEQTGKIITEKINSVTNEISQNLTSDEASCMYSSLEKITKSLEKVSTHNTF